MEPSYRDFFYRSSDGLKLHARVYGDVIAGQAPVVCLPGLTRNARDFHHLALFLSQQHQPQRQIVAFDYRGRGASASDPDWKNYTILVEAQDVVRGLEALGIAGAAFIGTSRGGLIIHVLAAMRPEMLQCAVLNDIGPVIEAGGLAQIRTYLSRATPLATFADATAHQRSVHGAAFTALTDEDWERMTRAIYRDEGGRPVADFDPALLRTLDNFEPAKPVPTLWPQFDELRTVPLLVIRGENSQLLAASTVEAMAKRHQNMQDLTIAGQGHPPMLETGGLPEQIAAFLDRNDSTLS